MNMIHLKTDPRKLNQQFGILLNDISLDVFTDEQLYRAIEQAGSAEIAILQAGRLDFRVIETNTPEEFRKKWIVT